MDVKTILFSSNDSIEILTTLVNGIRPGRLESEAFAIKKLESLSEYLKSDAQAKEKLLFHINAVIANSSAISLYTDSGIYSNSGFFSEFFQKFKHLLLPPLKDNSFTVTALRTIFHHAGDFEWLQTLPDSLLIDFFDLIGLTISLSHDSAETNEILNAMLIISHRISVMGLDPVLVAKIPGINSLDSPFFQLNSEVSDYIHLLKSNDLVANAENDEYSKLLFIISKCETKLDYIKEHKSAIGASLSLTFIVLRLNQHIERLKKLLQLLHLNGNERKPLVTGLLKEFVFNENTRLSLSRHISSNIGLLAYQVTEHAAHTGEHYVSTTRAEYFKFFGYALGGGAIVSVLVLIKLAVTSLHLPVLIETILNGLNYGIGFIIIHLAGFTLATKQPAMTASKLAGELEGHTDDEIGISNLAGLIVKISRTQFISFAGNLLMVFPCSWLLSYLYQLVTGNHPADLNKAHHLIEQLHPVYSASALYACVAGVLLFTAGLISGYLDNKTLYIRLPERLIQHPGLKFIKMKSRTRFARYIGNNLGSLGGNFILGFLLASMAFIGFILGLPLDVRHVTFVTGNFGLALESLNNEIPAATIWITLASIVMIGFLNFVVSFGLAIFVAIRSRKVKFKQTQKLLQMLFAYLLTYPTDFFFPPSRPRINSSGK